MARRIAEDWQAAEKVVLSVNGQDFAAYEGENLALALLADDHWHFRRNRATGELRAPFCLMGVCQDCLVLVDGERRLACQERVREGSVVSMGGEGG